MTLLVHTYVRGRSGEDHFLEDPEHGLTLAGFESSRTKLWGAPPVRELGARLFPELAAHSGYADDYVAARLANITAAAERAQDVDGGVIVW
ncbi:hypothetical protein P8A21_13395 [Streptomyces poriferorum]|uniref:hypothetical protein n=1 Tax=Streptomyces poriferorum TaxID=2798799 RepID=UPI00273D874F|nr:hypothetical protein [Streptomyces sp. Alt1]WLQ48431.1 hypothetical protein P8A21_13395 [Streptomyces sp. Alt1]